jgi:hypothetical protein
MILAGKPASGKTSLFIKLLTTVWKGLFHKIILICPTFEAQFPTVWSQIGPEGVTVYKGGITSDLVEKMYKDSQKDAAAGRTTLVTIDDCGEQMRRIDPAIFSMWVSNSRHLKTSIVHLTQKLTFSPTCLRSQADCLICFPATSYLDREALYREFSLVDRKTFFALLQKATREKYSFMACCTQPGGLLGLYESDLITPLVL